MAWYAATGWGAAGAAVVLGLLVQLVPLVAFPTVLSQDGPAHVDSAWVLAHWGDGGPVGAVLHGHYRIDLSPVPNLLTTLVLAGLLPLVGADAAERLLVAALTAGLVLALGYAARGVDRRAGWLALAALPLGGSHLVVYGFYNFLAGVVAALLVLGLALRRRTGWSAPAAGGLALLLALTWSAHLLPFLVALGGAGLLGVTRALQERRTGCPTAAAAGRHLLPVAVAALPALALTAVYETSGKGPAGQPVGRPSVGRLLSLVTGSRPFVVGEHAEHVPAFAAAVVLAVLLWTALRPRSGDGATPARTPERTALALLLIAAVAVFSLTPARLGTEFGFLVDRTAWFPVLLVPLFAATRLPPRRAATALAAVLVAASSLAVIVRLPFEAQASRQVEQLLAAAPAIRPGSTLVVLRYARAAPPEPNSPDALRHASSRLAFRTNSVDVGHYEAVEQYFQVGFTGTPDLRRALDPTLRGLERVPPAVDLPAVRGRVDYVVVVGLDRARPEVRSSADARSVRDELAAHYLRVPTPPAAGGVEVWRPGNP